MKTMNLSVALLMLSSSSVFALDFTTSVGSIRLTEETITDGGLVFTPESTSLNFGVGAEQSFGKFKIGASAVAGNVNYSTPKPQSVLDSLVSLNVDIAAETASLAALNSNLALSTDATAPDIQAQIKDSAARLDALTAQVAALELPYKRDSQHSGLNLSSQYMLTDRFGSGAEIFVNSDTSESIPNWIATYSAKHGTTTYGVKLNVGDGWAGGSVVASF